LDKGSAVAIDMPMNVNSVVIYLAIVLAGYIVVSIADSFAPIEISTRLKISEAKAIFTQVITLFFFSVCWGHHTFYLDFFGFVHLSMLHDVKITNFLQLWNFMLLLHFQMHNFT
jgi:hypothetical protein